MNAVVTNNHNTTPLPLGQLPSRIMVDKASFPVRKVELDFQPVPRDWLDNNPVLSQMLNALSAMFPEGEQFFVDSVRAVRDDLKHYPDLQKEISAFIGQEAMHSKVHADFNQYAGSDAMRRLEGLTGRLLRGILDNRLLPFMRGRQPHLATTVALEHFTGVIAAQLMRREDIQAMMHPVMRQLWLWHAIEENEHKAVCFDAYEAKYGRTFQAWLWRILAFSIAMPILIGSKFAFTGYLLATQGGLTNLAAWRSGLRLTWGRQGFFTQLWRDMLDYYRPDFHPWQHDTHALVARYRERLGIA